ncbi:MAG: shikimate kinase [Lachnospiraceae bacterium]
MRQKGDSIILIGMPGCGKSTVGVVLAKALGMNFIDTDLLISSRYGLTLQEIIDVRGLEMFLAYEEQAGLSVCDRRAVIATGGSMVFSGKAMEHLSGLGTVVYLDVGLQELEERLTNIRTRGVASRRGRRSRIFTGRARRCMKRMQSFGFLFQITRIWKRWWNVWPFSWAGINEQMIEAGVTGFGSTRLLHTHTVCNLLLIYCLIPFTLSSAYLSVTSIK